MGATAPSPGRFQTHVNPEGRTSAGFLIPARFFPQVCAGAAAPRPHKLCPEDGGQRAGQGTHPPNFPAAALSFARAPSAQPPLPPAPQRGRGTGVPLPFSPAACTRAAVPTEATSAASLGSAARAGRRGIPHAQVLVLGAEKQSCGFPGAFREEPCDGGRGDTSPLTPKGQPGHLACGPPARGPAGQRPPQERVLP